jgi:hypothetical protein
MVDCLWNRKMAVLNFIIKAAVFLKKQDIVVCIKSPFLGHGGMKEVIAVFIYVYPDWISLDISRNVLKCYWIIMDVIYQYTISMPS